MKFRLIAISLFFVCALSLFPRDGKISQPVQEISRGLSLPRKTWGASTGFAIDVMEFENFEGFDFLMEGSGLEYLLSMERFAFPYVAMGERFELHFNSFMPSIVFYPVKNMIIADGTYAADGPNLTIDTGIDMVISGWNGIPVKFNYFVGYRFKSAITDWLWLDSRGGVSLDLDLEWKGYVALGTGLQLSDNFSFHIEGALFRGTGYVTNGISYNFFHMVSLDVPLTLKINFNQEHSLALIARYKLLTDWIYDWNDSWNFSLWDRTDTPIGLQYTVTW